MDTCTDGFIVPVPKDRIEEYRKIAELSAKVYMDLGALEYREWVADDTNAGDMKNFPQLAELKENETIIRSGPKATSSRPHAKSKFQQLVAVIPSSMIFNPPTGFIARAGQPGPTIALLAAVALYPSIASGATFTVPLAGLDQPDGNNEFVTADYDLKVTFSHIESVTLDFIMPDGYRGGGATTGNSSFFTQLKVVLHDLEDPSLLDPLPLPILSPYAAWQSTYRVLPQISTHLSFGNTFTICDPNGECPEPPTPEWPDFILSGQGRLSFINVTDSSFHPLPSGTVVSSSTTLNSPGVVSEAYLTIVGTPVPEPNSLVILLSSVAFISRYRIRKPNRT